MGFFNKATFEQRIHEIDLIRGLLMILVILDHFLLTFRSFCGQWNTTLGGNVETLKNIFDFFTWYYNSVVRNVIRYTVLFGFTFVSGISCAFSKNNWKRAGIMITVWMAVALCTNMFSGIADATHTFGTFRPKIDFNVLGVLGWSILIYCFFQNKNWKWFLVIGSIFIALHPLVQWASTLDAFQYDPANGKYFFFPMLFRPYEGWDWMPLVPYIGFFFFGAAVGNVTYAIEKRSYFKRHEWERPFCFIGRHSIFFYGGHVVILYGVFYLITLFVRA